MSETELKYADMFKGTEAAEKNYRKRIEKSGADFRESQSLFVKSIDLKRRQITALASSADLDRDEEIILPEAFKKWLPTYIESGGVVITSHQHRLQTGHSSVVGNVIKAWVDKQGLWTTIEFIKGTVLGDEYGFLYTQKKQRALSVGFIPHEWQYEEREGKRVRVYTEIELLEISCVPVGSNREALSKSKQRKADFVARKKAEQVDQEEERILEKMRAENPNFDADCEEFGRLTACEDMGEGEVPDDYEIGEEADAGEGRYARMFQDGPRKTYSDLFI